MKVNPTIGAYYASNHDKRQPLFIKTDSNGNEKRPEATPEQQTKDEDRLVDMVC